MHVAAQLFTPSFESTIEQVAVNPELVLPDWDRADRFGLVVDEPLGGLGASLLMQLAIAEFYRIRRLNNAEPIVYPEVYVFHVGGPHGDFSLFDVWPPRKEVLVPTGQPISLLEALNTTAITRLALPEGTTGAMKDIETGITTWADKSSFCDRTRSVFVYDPSGLTHRPDVSLASSDSRVQENVMGTLFPVDVATDLLDEIAQGGSVNLPGLSVTADIVKWGQRVRLRGQEVSPETRDIAAAAYQQRLQNDGRRVFETYRRISTEDALVRIAGF